MSYRYIKFSVIKRRSGGSGYIQLSEIEFLDRNGNKFLWPQDTVITASSTPADVSEDAINIIDGLTSTKYCGNTPGYVDFIIDLGESNAIDIGAYRIWCWYTANDYNSRDPVSFSLSVSDDGIDYEEVDSIVDATITTARSELAYSGIITPPYDIRYLIGDVEGKLYTIEEDALVELSETNLTKALFVSEGLENTPDGSVMLELSNPRVYCWQDSNDTLPIIRMELSETPNPQVVISDNVYLTHRTIAGVENVTIDSDDNTLFAVSFDDGQTWWNYVNDTWALLSEELSGQTRESIEAISTNAWAEKISAGGRMKFRFVLAGNGYVDNITVHFLN